MDLVVDNTRTAAPAASDVDEAEAAARVLGVLEGAGARRVTVPVLQPAAPFLELSGEELAKRIYLTSDPSSDQGGRELCLRPEFTIPLSRLYLEDETPGARAMYAYSGTVFRDRGGVGEFAQVGVELFGDADGEDADARLLALAVECSGLDAPLLHLGDAGLFETYLTALELPRAIERHLRRRFSRSDDLKAEIEAMIAGRGEVSALVRLLADAGEDERRAVVTEMLRLAGVEDEAGAAHRSSADIAERYIERALVGAGAGLDPDKAALLIRYLEVDASPWEALDALEAIARRGELRMNGTLDDFARRLGLIADEGVDLYDNARFSTAFARRIDYYSGLVFELRDAENAEIGPVIGGGRYDGLLKRLGGATDVPAVGFSVWPERLKRPAS